MGFGQGTLLLVEGAAHRLAQSLKARASRGSWAAALDDNLDSGPSLLVMSDADASNVAHDLRLAVGRLARRLQQQPPCLPRPRG